MIQHVRPPTTEPAILPRLRAALRSAHPDWARSPLQPLPDRGLAHLHVRIVDHGVLARIPKQSQLGLAPAANLAHQQACFERCAPSGHTPRLVGVLPADADLPRGALLVQEIVGTPVALPGGLASMARALAALHRLELPPPALRPPLSDAPDPLRQLGGEIVGQAAYLPDAGLAASVRQAITQELAALEATLHDAARPARRLIAFDAHPGNFLVDASGDAILVDLEKCRYSHPGLDLAHATLYTSTTWDVATRAVLSVGEVLAFYREWEAAVGPQRSAEARRWHLPLRHAMWLWSLTWCCKWRVLSARPPGAPGQGEDWSTAHGDAALAAHVRGRVDAYLGHDAIRFVQEELAQLREGLRA